MISPGAVWAAQTRLQNRENFVFLLENYALNNLGGGIIHYVVFVPSSGFDKEMPLSMKEEGDDPDRGTFNMKHKISYKH